MVFPTNNYQTPKPNAAVGIKTSMLVVGWNSRMRNEKNVLLRNEGHFERTGRDVGE
jgi:hypothetical protein